MRKDIHTYVIAGDMNINISSDDDYVQEYLNILGEYGFSSYINGYTRVYNNQMSIIDHFFVKSKLNTTEILSIIYRTLITDHYPIIMYLPIKTKLINQVNELNNTYCKKFINYSKLKSDLQKEDWHEIYENICLNEATNNFVNKLKLHIDNNTNIIKQSNTKRPKKDWITTGLLNSINNKNKMYKLVKNNPNDDELKNNYKQYKNKLVQLIKTTKSNFYRDSVFKDKNSSQNLWHTVNELCNRHKTDEKIEKIEINDNTIVCEQKIANEFNLHYGTVGEAYANKIRCNENINFNDNVFCNTLFLTPTSESEIKNLIMDLKIKKSPGLDNIKSETLKEIANEILVPLKYLINKSFETGIFPNVLKIGVIKPIYKSGNKLKVENYRPITLISSIAKLFEKIIKERLQVFLKKYNILSDKQFGFRIGKSTQDAIAYLLHKIYEKMDMSKPALCVFLDLAKAFDTVCHKKLIGKLECIGIRGNVLNLLKSYLSDRVQYVKIGQSISSPMKVRYGVPQGTVLGPVLFIIYLNNLLNLPSTGEMVSFADDTAILYSAETWDELKVKAEADLENIKNWFDYNILTLNCNKTKYLPFCSYASGLPNMGSLNINQNNCVEEGDSVKYLGIIIDKHLRWDLQIKHASSKVRYLLGTFKYLKKFLNKEHLKIVYQSLVEPHFSYGIIGWGGLTKTHVTKLEILQKRFLKIIFNKNYTYPSNLLFSESKTLDIRQLYSLIVLVHLQKNKDLIEYNDHNYGTRHKNTITKKPLRNKKIGQRCYTHLGYLLYDQIPDELKNINTTILFRKKVKKWLLDFNRNKLHNIING